MVMSAEAARNVVGIIGNVISFFLFLSPVPTFLRILKKKSVEEFKPDPYLATIMNCMCWILYGIPVVHPDSTLVVTINSVGLALEVIYIIIFFTYADKKKRLKIVVVLVIELACLACLAALTILLSHTHERRSLVVGIVCVAFGAFMYLSPLTIMAKVIKTKSVEFMPFYLSLANFLNGCIWTAYALIKIDPFILVSNGLGAASGTAQLILYACYYKSTPRGDGAKPSQVQLPGPNAAADIIPA